MMFSIGKTYGALLLGSLFASLLSGMLSVQCFIYARLYGGDRVFLKFLVAGIWLLDVFHNAAVWTSMWVWVVDYFGKPERLDTVPTGIPVSIIVTGVLTFLVHCFFAYRIYNLGPKYRLAVTIPIALLALLRLASALGTSFLMLKNPSLVFFKSHHRWIFSTGLGLSSAVDILITFVMMFILHGSRSTSLSLDLVIRSLIFYTLENGAITTAATVVSMICWLAMDNLIFLALHFIIAKLYANSVLAMLNCRQGLRRLGNTDGVVDLAYAPDKLSGLAMEVTVNRSVEFRVDV